MEYAENIGVAEALRKSVENAKAKFDAILEVHNILVMYYTLFNLAFHFTNANF